MKDEKLYTIAELMLFPGINHKFINDTCEELKIKPGEARIYGRKTEVYKRLDFEQILGQKGYERVKIDNEYFWVRYRVKDLIQDED